MNNRVAHNISIANLIGALSELMTSGNTWVDIMIDNEFTLRLRGSSIKREIENKNDELPDWTDLDELT